jgi:hypothetical protein
MQRRTLAESRKEFPRYGHCCRVEPAKSGTLQSTRVKKKHSRDSLLPIDGGPIRGVCRLQIEVFHRSLSSAGTMNKGQKKKKDRQ